MRPNLMASSSMTPLSRTATQNPTPKPPEEEKIGIGTAEISGVSRIQFVEVSPTPEAKKTKKAADDEDKDDDKKDDDDDDDDAKALAAGNDDAGDRIHRDSVLARHVRDCERGRVLAILDSPAGKTAFAANPEKTLRFALTHPGTRLEAIATLELFGGNLQPSAKAPLRERMENVKVDIGQDAVGGPPDDRAALAQAIVLAGKRRRGEID